MKILPHHTRRSNSWDYLSMKKEKNGNVNIFSKLLDDNRPLRDEDAYCNMYVFRNQAQVKQFQDGTKAASVLN